MTKRDFWRNASRWGAITGAGLFVISLLAWALGLGAEKLGWLPETLRFVLILSVIVVTGRRNAAMCDSAIGYPYGRAVGFIIATMMFAGIVAGVGEFLMANFIAREHYDAMMAAQMDNAMRIYQGTPMAAQMAGMRDQMLRMLANPIVLIVSGVINWVIKGGFLGLILGAFVQKKPDIFASNVSGNE